MRLKLILLVPCFAVATLAANVVTFDKPSDSIWHDTERIKRDTSATTKNESKSQPRVRSLRAVTTILSRFAMTVVTSQIANAQSSDAEATFVVQLPDAAFISNFTMNIENRLIVGEVKAKEKAKQEYDAARRRGESAGHVAQSPRETNTFRISVNVAKRSKVALELTYQEVLKRTHGVYKHIINVDPGQVVDDLKVDVYVEERTEITLMLAPQFGPKVGEMTNKELLKLPASSDVRIRSSIESDYSHLHFSFHPTRAQQGRSGLKGQMVVLYDVKRNVDGGQLMVVNGYFVHFFAPEGLPVASKHVVFVLDTSGSMMGRKIAQTKDAMKVILRDLNEEDHFNIFTFSNTVQRWRQSSLPVNAASVKAAVEFVDRINADGGTNINDAMVSALQHLSSPNGPNTLMPVVIFMTDGQPTSGETNRDELIRNLLEANNGGETVVHSIGFGNNVDFKLLKKMSLLNHGVARKVYEDSDAALQLAGFYAEVSSPLLKNVKIRYLNETAEPGSLLLDDKYTAYNGGEVMVVGKLANAVYSGDSKPKTELLSAEVEALGRGGAKKFTTRIRLPNWPCRRPWRPCRPRPIPFPPMTTPSPLPIQSIGGFIERMWAYQTIKKLLETEKYLENNASKKTELKKKALQLSLKYNFVTELTSMVVIQPNTTHGNRKPLLETESSAVSRPSGSSRRRGGSTRRNGWGGGGGGGFFKKLSKRIRRPHTRIIGRRLVVGPAGPGSHPRGRIMGPAGPIGDLRPTRIPTVITTTATVGTCNGKPNARSIRCEEVKNSSGGGNWLQIRIINGIDIGAVFDCTATPVVCGCRRGFVFAADRCRRLYAAPKTADEHLVSPCAGQCEPTCDEPTPICGRACLRHSYAYVCKDGLVRNQEGNCVALDDCVDDEIFFF